MLSVSADLAYLPSHSDPALFSGPSSVHAGQGQQHSTGRFMGSQGARSDYRRPGMIPRVRFTVISASSRPFRAGKCFRTPIQPPHLATNSPPPGIPSLRPHHLPSRRHIAAESLTDIPFRLASNESITSLLFDSFLQLSPQGHSRPTHIAFAHLRRGCQLTCRLCRPDTLLPTTTTNTHTPRICSPFPSLVNCHQSLKSHLCPPFQAHQL